MKKIITIYLCAIVLLTSGCVKFTLRLNPALITDQTNVMFKECDPEIGRLSIPASLKFLEGLLESDKDNKQILSALSMGYSGYAMLFVEDENPESASYLYIRAKNYGLKALGVKQPSEMESIKNILDNVSETELDALFWTAFSWNAWIRLNLHKPDAIGQVNIAQAFLKKIIELNQDFFYGAPNVLMGVSLSSMPLFSKEDSMRARSFFERAKKQNGLLLAHFCYAKFYAVRIQDKELFNRLLDEIDKTSLNTQDNICLINSVIKQKAIKLKEIADDLFI